MLSESGMRTFEQLVACFGGRESHVLRVPNSYCGCSECESDRPWLRVYVPGIEGSFVLGWRKRVVEIRWDETGLLIGASDVAGGDDVTVGGDYVHAWGYEKVAVYVSRLLASKTHTRSTPQGRE